MQWKRWKNYFWIFTRVLTKLTVMPTLLFCVVLYSLAEENRDDASRRMWQGVTIFDSSEETVVLDCLKAGADIDQGYDGKTYLMAAVEASNLDYVRILVKLGADVNLRDNHGDTALALANKGGRTEIARFLQRHGAR
ncbi:MAG: ankyrin repeat domain-containing protein [Armatimonadota bacterium]